MKAAGYLAMSDCFAGCGGLIKLESFGYEEEDD